MELTVEVARTKTDPVESEVLFTGPLEVEGLDSPEQFSKPLFIAIHLRMVSDEEAEAEEPAAEEAPAAAPDTELLEVTEAQPEKAEPATPEPETGEPEEPEIAPEEAGPEPPPQPATPPSSAPAAGGDQPMGPGSDSPVLEVVEEAVQPAQEAPAEPAEEDATSMPALREEEEGPLIEVEDVKEPDSAAKDIGEFQQKVEKAAGSLKGAEITFPTIRQEGIGGMGGAGGGAGKLQDPKPVPKKPPKATEVDPVPHAIWQIDKATVDESGKNPLLLEKIDLPKIEQSPQGNLPKRGDQALAPGEFSAALSFGKQYQKKADDFAKQFEDPAKQMCVDPQQSFMSPNGLTPEEEHIRDVYDVLKNGPKPKPPPKPPVPKTAPVKPNPDVIESKAEPLLLPPLRPDHPENKAQDAAQREAVAQTFARLLASPDATATEALIDVANMIAPGGVVHDKFPDLGSGQKPALKAELEKNFRDMAKQAGASEELLNKAVEDRKRELEEKAKGVQHAANNVCAADAKNAAQQAGAVTANVDANAQAQKAHAKAVADAAKKMTPAQKAEAKREELITKAREKAAAYNGRYQRMKESRKSDIAKVRGEYLNAYQYAEQKDELKINEKPDQTPEQRQDQITASLNWLKENKDKINKTFDSYNTAADTGTQAFIDAVNDAAKEAFKEIREWAAKKMGQTIAADEQQKQATADWAALTQANADVWQALENRKAAAVANYYIDYYVEIRDKKLEGADRDKVLGDQKIGQDKRMIASALFGKSGEDPLDVIAKGIRDRFMQDKRDKLRPKLREEMMKSTDWASLSPVGSAIGPVAKSAEDVARQIHDVGLHGGILGRNDVPKVMGALTGLNDVQSRAVDLFYWEKYGMSLDADLKDQLDAFGEYDRAKELIYLASLSDKTGPEAEEARAEARAAAAAGELYAAGTGKVGTDEDAFFRILRSLSDNEDVKAQPPVISRKRVERIYLDRYGHTLAWAIDDEMSGNEAKRAEALRKGEKDKADAIAVDDALNFRFWGPNREDAEKVYSDTRDEIIEQARREGRSSEWVQVEAKRRAVKMELIYDTEIAGTVIAGRYEYNEKGEQVPYVRPKLRDSYDKLFPAADSDVLKALADGDETKADAARVKAEDRSFWYVSDNKINDILMSQYERARKYEELDSGRALRYMEEQKMKREEEEHFTNTGRFWDPPERFKRQQQLELNVERALDARAETRAAANMKSLSQTYETMYPGSTLQAVVSDHMGGNAQTAAQAMLDQGYLTPYQRLKLGIEGIGTKEKLVKDTLRGRTKKEIEDLDALWQKDHPGETLFEALSDDLSGDDWIEAQVSYQGRPMDIDQAVALARFKEEKNRAGWFGRAILGSEDAMVESSLTELENLRNRLKDPRNANLTPDEQQGMIDVFNGQREVVDSAIETRNTVMNQVTDSIVNAVTIALAVVAFVGSFFTGGLTAAIGFALIMSVITTGVSIGLRAALMGGHYGLEQLYTDLAIGVIDAIVAVMTAGLGNRLLGLRQGVMKGAELAAEQGAKEAAKKTIFRSLRTMLGKQIGPLADKARPIAFLKKMAEEEAAWYSKLIAHGVSTAIENTVQAVPSAVAGQVLDERNYEHGNAFLNIVGGAAEQVGTSVVQGMVMAAGMHVLGAGLKAGIKFAKGPVLGPEGYHKPVGEMTEPEFDANYREYEKVNPGATREDFRLVVDREQAAINRRAAEQQEQRQKFRDEMDNVLKNHEDKAIRDMAGQLGDVPISHLDPVDFARVAGIGAPDVVMIIKDGQVHIIAREGASPASVQRIAAEVAAHVEPGTHGRVRDPNQVLPKDLRGAVNVRIDPSPARGPRHVEVSLTPRLEIVAGPGATAADIAGHVKTARSQLRLEGARGRVLKMFEQIKTWNFEHGFPPKGSRAYEAHFEVEKLPGIIEQRKLELLNPDLSPQQRAHVEDQVQSLLQQLETHSQTLKEFDRSPGRGFIAAEDTPPRQEKYRDSIRADEDAHERTPIDHESKADRSPMHGKEVDGKTVVSEERAGKIWKEKDPATGDYDEYRRVIGFDEHGNKIISYEEIRDKNGRWRMRGSESTDIGGMHERASQFQMDAEIAKAHAQGLPDFQVPVQKEGGQGIDKLKVSFAKEDVVRRGRGYQLRDDAAPMLVLGEDKKMGHVTRESITAIKENLEQHLLDIYKKLESGDALLPVEHGGYGLTAFQAKALKLALEKGNFRFEIRVDSEASLGSVAGKSEAQLERMILPNLKAEIENLLKGTRFAGRPVEVDRVVIDPVFQERAATEARIKKQAETLKLDPTNPDHLQVARVSLLGQDVSQPPALRITEPVFDAGTNTLFDKGGGGRAIQSHKVQGMDKTPTELAAELLGFLKTKPKSPVTRRLAEPFVILDLSGVPARRRDAIKKALARLESQDRTGKLQNVLFFTDDSPVLSPLVSRREVSALVSSSPRK